MQPGCSWAELLLPWRRAGFSRGERYSKWSAFLPSFHLLLSAFPFLFFFLVVVVDSFSHQETRGFYKETWDSKKKNQLHIHLLSQKAILIPGLTHVCNDRLLKKEGSVAPKFTGLNLASDFWAIPSVFQITRITAIAQDKVLTWVKPHWNGTAQPVLRQLHQTFGWPKLSHVTTTWVDLCRNWGMDLKDITKGTVRSQMVTGGTGTCWRAKKQNMRKQRSIRDSHKNAMGGRPQEI